MKKIILNKVFQTLAFCTTLFLFPAQTKAAWTYTLASPNPAIAAANACPNTTKVPIYFFTIGASGSSTASSLTGFNFTTNAGYVATSVVQFQLWRNTTNNFAGAIGLGALASVASSGPGLQTFPAFAYLMNANGGTYYYWITMDVAISPTIGNTITVAALTTGNLTITGGSPTKTGAGNIGGTQTIIGITTQPTGTAICSGSSATLTVGTSAGPAWTYQWINVTTGLAVVNGTPAGATYSGNTTSSLTVNGLTANNSYRCNVSGACTITSNNATITISAPVTPPAVTIEAYDLFGNPLSNTPTICQFQSIDFYVTTPYENTEPKTFHWKKNGVIQFTQASTNPSPPGIAWNSSTLANGDVVTLTVVFTAPPPCYSPDSVTSQSMTFTVTPNQPPFVTITDNSPNDTICRGNTITFTANPSEAGSPTYQWYLDGAPVGTASTYTTLPSLLAGNHSVYCEITSSEACDSQDPVFNPVATSPTTAFNVDPCYYFVPASGSLGPYTTCGSPFYDSFNDNPANYATNVNGLVKFCPAVAGQYVTISFTSLTLQDVGDRLRIFSGTPASTLTADTSGIPLFNAFGFTNSAGCGSVVTSNVSGGCLTVHFKTDASGVAAGWVANVSCSPTPSAGPIAGTSCALPTVISALPYTVTNHTTQCYVNDYQAQAGICNTSYAGEDHVYQYTATGPECTSITVSGASSASLSLAVYQGCPGSGGSCITPTPQTGNSSAQVTFPGAGTYYIIVDAPSGFVNYNLSIVSFGIAPDNDLPCNAQYIDLSVNVNGNNTCTGAASEPGNPSCWTGGALNTNWFSFTAPASGSVRIRATAGSIGSTQIALYSGTCSSLSEISCNQSGPNCASGGTFTSSEIAFSGLTPNAIYFIRVDGRLSATGNYSLIVVDQTGPQPYVDGQDCISPMTVCNSSFTVGNPGFLWTGWVCDFPAANASCMAAGERSSAWYVINTNAAGNFSFSLTPLGSTDYDWVLFDITGLGSDQASRLAAACTLINNNNLAGANWVRCNWSAPQTTSCGGASPYVTGMCSAYANISAGGGGPNFSNWYPVTAGNTLLLNLSNFTQNATGFTLDFNNNSNVSPISYSNPPSVLYWTAGANNTDWFNPVNWGNCGPPTCSSSAVITTGSSFMPVINANGAVCRDLDIKAGASVTINAGIQLDVCRNYINNGSLIAATTSTVRVMGTVPQYFDGNMIGSSAFGNLWMNKTSNHMTILDHARVAGNLTLGTLTGGKIITGNKILYIINSAAGSATSGGSGSYVEGFLRRNLSGTAGTYYWPVGTSTKGFQLASIQFYGTHSIGNILGYFTGNAVPIPAGPLGPECPTNDFTTMAPLDNGYWTMTADANATSATYKMTLYNLNYTNSSGATAWTVLKATTAAGPWILSGNCIGSTAAATARDNMTGFSVFTSGQSGVQLPVELLTFAATLENSGVSLYWETASEINNHHFDIERSRDGEHFEKIGEKAGAGNSTVNLYYTIYDPNPFIGINYYRLKQVDFDGTFKYSDKVYVVVYPEAGMVSVYPNPAQTDLWCDFYSNGSGKLQFEIMDVLGKTFAAEVRDVKKGLNAEVKFNISNLPQGVYFIRVKAADGSNIMPTSQMRFVKQMKED
jgi:hypothetical protein